MFATTIAGSLPKPLWLAEPNTLWAPWRQEGRALDEAKRDATILALKLQEDSGIDIVSDGEQSRQHFVHGFLESVAGVDFARKTEIGIRADVTGGDGNLRDVAPRILPDVKGMNRLITCQQDNQIDHRGDHGAANE